MMLFVIVGFVKIFVVSVMNMNEILPAIYTLSPELIQKTAQKVSHYSLHIN